MNKYILTSLSALILTISVVPGALAQKTAVDSSFPQAAETAGMGVTPFNLVFLAYQGFFESEGIPMAASLVSGYESGRITAQDLVQAAIKMNRLSPSAVDDSNYISSVKKQLDALRDRD